MRWILPSKNMLLSIFLIGFAIASEAQDYTDCIITKSSLLSKEILESKVNKAIKDLVLNEVVILDEGLIKEKLLIRSPFQKSGPGSIDYLIGEKLIFQQYDNSELTLKDSKGTKHYVYLNGDFRDRDIALSIGVRKIKEAIEIDSTLIGKRVVLNDRSIDSVFDPIVQYEVGLIKYSNERDKFYLLLKKINPDGTKQEGFTGFNIADSRFGILDYGCFIAKYNAHKNRYLDHLSSKFTAKEIESIKNGTLFIGMSEEAVPHAIGYPNQTNTTVVAGGTSKQLVYGDGVFVYIVDGKVSAYQNLESLRGF